MSVINSLELSFISVNKNNIIFQRDDNAGEDVSLMFEVQSVSSENLNNRDEYKLTFIYDSKGINKPVEKIADLNKDDFDFSIEYAVDYFFKITDIDVFDKISEKEKNEYCANLVYLDFRRRVLFLMSSIGVGSFKLPLSLAHLKRENGPE